MTCLDAEDTVGFQLAALARQRCPQPWELLICDGGSSDDTIAVAESWAGRLPLRIIRANERGRTDAVRYAGVFAARGEWIGLCEPHDEVGDGWLAALCAALAEHSCVTGRFATEWVRPVRAQGVGLLDPEFGLQRASDAGARADAAGANAGIRRSVFLAAGGPDPSPSRPGETDLGRRMRLARSALIIDPSLVVHKRRRAGRAGSRHRTPSPPVRA